MFPTEVANDLHEPFSLLVSVVHLEDQKSCFRLQLAAF